LRQNLAIAPDCAVAKFWAQLAKLYLAKFLAQFVLRLPSLAMPIKIAAIYIEEQCKIVAKHWFITCYAQVYVYDCLYINVEIR